MIGAGEVLSLTTLWLLAVVPRVSDAIDRTRAECEQLKTEQTAFRQFAKRVAALDPDEHGTGTESDSIRFDNCTGSITVLDPVDSVVEQASSEPVSMESVRNAYRETVMSVSHYEDEYNEPFVENLRAELDPTLARSVVEGDVLTPQIQTAILNQAQQARKQRLELFEYAEIEHNALIEARRQLREMHETTTTIKENLYPRPVRELVQSWDRLEVVATDCETLLYERQNDIQTEGGTMSIWLAQKYFYKPFQWKHPILSDGVDMLTRIRNAKQDVAQAIYDW